MRSFEYGYLLETPLTHALAMTMRALADLRKVRKLTCLKRGPDAEWQKVKG